MNTSIKTLEDVRSFATHLICDRKISIHPDDDFNDYIDLGTGENLFAKSDADKMNTLMDICFQVCENEGEDIYELMGEILSKEIQLDKFIPQKN